MAALATALPGLVCAAPNALQFAGDNDRVVLAALPAFATNLATKDFTVTAWVRLEGGTQAGRLFYAQADTANFATLLFIAGGATLYVVVANQIYSIGVPRPPAGIWTHVTARWTAATRTPEILYDGVLQSGGAGGASSVGTSGVMTIGSRTDGVQSLAGAIDDFAIWNVYRTTPQIRVERISTCASYTGLAARYDFDVGVPGGDNTAITTVPDVATTTLPGTLTGFALTGQTSNFIASPLTRIAPALSFDPPLSLATGENGTTATGAVRLAVPPVEDVIVSLASSVPGEATVDPAQLAFTPDDWDQPHTFTVTGVDDPNIDGPRGFTVTATASSADRCQDALSATIAGTNADDDVGALTIADASAAEGSSSPLQLPVTYAGPNAAPFTVAFSTSPVTALAGVDYVTTTGTLSFTGVPGETQLADVALLDNSMAQNDRGFSVQLGTPSLAGVALGDGAAMATTIDDDHDVGVTLDNGIDSVEAGQAVLYELVVQNWSPKFAESAVPISFVAVPLENLSWTCVASGGAVCSSGSGEFGDLANLPALSQASYVVSGTVATTAAPGGVGALVALATADLAQDSNPADNLAVDVDGGAVIFADGFE